jgi:hypothetical protein
MTKSSDDWLTVRELADSRSRSTTLATAFAEVISPDDLAVDLGCGTGANIRYLAHYLSLKQNWLASPPAFCSSAPLLFENDFSMEQLL